MPKKQDAQPVPFDLTSLRSAKHYVWREIEREDDAPLRVKLLELNIREADAIPFKTSTKLSESLQASAPFVAEWDFRAENLDTGETVDVPPPAEVGWEVLELLDQGTAAKVVTWLKYPHVMLLENEKKDSTSSESAAKPSANGTTATP